MPTNTGSLLLVFIGFTRSYNYGSVGKGYKKRNAI